MNHTDLDAEYTPRAAAADSSAASAIGAAACWACSACRWADVRRWAAAVAELAGRWGLKKKARR
jgi:hypothetical protein